MNVEQVSIEEDIERSSMFKTVEQLVRSHVHRALGAMRYSKDDMVIWCDFPYEKFKMSGGVVTGYHPWLNEQGIREGDYKYKEYKEFCYGLSPAMQSIRFTSDEHLKLLGIKMREQPVPFKTHEGLPWPEDQTRPMKYLIMEWDAIDTEPYKSRLLAFTTLD